MDIENKNITIIGAGISGIAAAQLRKIYTGKPQSTILSVFGNPAKMEGANWVYKGVKVNNAIPGKVATTVTFTIQNGVVAAVLFAE